MCSGSLKEMRGWVCSVCTISIYCTAKNMCFICWCVYMTVCEYLYCMYEWMKWLIEQTQTATAVSVQYTYVVPQYFFLVCSFKQQLNTLIKPKHKKEISIKYPRHNTIVELWEMLFRIFHKLWTWIILKYFRNYIYHIYIYSTQNILCIAFLSLKCSIDTGFDKLGRQCHARL